MNIFGNLINIGQLNIHGINISRHLKLILQNTKHQNSIIYTINTRQLNFQNNLKQNFTSIIFSNNKYKIHVPPPKNIPKPPTKP